MIKTEWLEMIGTLVLFLFVGIVAASSALPIITRVVLATISIAGVIWDLLSIRTVDPQEMGIKVLFGKTIAEAKSGFHWLPKLPQCYIRTIPKERFELDYQPRLVISKRGKWPEQQEGEEEPQIFGKQLLLVTATVYTEFARDFQALNNIVERNIPTTAAAIRDKTDGLIDGAFRDAIGSMTWGKATESSGRKEILSRVKRAIKGSTSYFRVGGFNVKETQVVLRVVDLKSEALKKAMAEPDIERFSAEGAEYEAERVLKETEVLGEIRTALTKRGFSKEKADEIARNIYELQVSADLQRETGLEVVKLIRFQTPSSAASAIVEGIAAFGAASRLLQQPPSEKKIKKNEPPAGGRKKIEDMTLEEKEAEAEEYLEETLSEEEATSQAT